MTPRQLVVSIFLVCVLCSVAHAVPTVFPDGVTIHESGATEGYVLMSAVGRAKLVDMNGNVVHSWSGPYGRLGGLVRPLDNGHVLSRSGGSVVELDWDGNVVWQFDEPEDVSFHHDMERLPNGNTLILCRQVVTDLSISDTPVDDDFILEVTPAGDIAWEWHTVDHFDEFGFSDERRALIHEHGANWSHANAISPIPESTTHADARFAPGNIVMSYRAQNMIVVIDRGTGQIVWSAIDRTIGQHNAHMLPGDVPGGGNLLAFDNGWNGQFSIAGRHFSRVVEIDPLSDSLPWTYDATKSGYRNTAFFSGVISGAQRLPGGNTLIVEGVHGRVFEVTPDGRIVWEYVNDSVGANNARNVYRAYKVPLEWAATRFAPDLVVSPAGISDGVAPGRILRAGFDVKNAAAEPAIDVVVTYTAADDTSFFSLSAPDGWDCTTPEVRGEGSITCTTSSLGPGESGLFTIGTRVSPCVEGGEALVHGLSASSVGDEANPADNRLMVETGITFGARTKRLRSRCSNLASP